MVSLCFEVFASLLVNVDVCCICIYCMSICTTACICFLVLSISEKLTVDDEQSLFMPLPAISSARGIYQSGCPGMVISGYVHLGVRLCVRVCASVRLFFHLYISQMHRHILTILTTVTYYQVNHVTMMTLPGHEFIGQGHRNAFRRSHTGRLFSIEHCLV